MYSMYKIFILSIRAMCIDVLSIQRRKGEATAPGTRCPCWLEAPDIMITVQLRISKDWIYVIITMIIIHDIK